MVKRDPFLNAVNLAHYARDHMNLDISKWTARRILRFAGLPARRPAKKPYISRKNRAARLRFAREHEHWAAEDWARVLWSDESKFNLFGSDGINYVRRPAGKRFDRKYTRPTVKHGGGNIMI